ncbi:MAG: hypothetical protein HUJ30_01375 [Gammaproteobacteria bacterium]|nr:hypothetical protein [Gammaproteobacteria bacterium]
MNMMKRGVITTGIMLLLSVFSSQAFAEGAEVRIDATACNVFNGDGGLTTIYPPDAVVQAVLTPSGNHKITCSGDLPAGAPVPSRGAKLFDPSNSPYTWCGTTFGVSTDFHAVVTPSGHATLQCIVNPSGS